ncbi:MAG TPA: UPF0175 family protein [Verrucomicrobiales bacterium]|jgi:hypothetical protein|nr:UPF0175 family protein [Verrucomicrobiales bacterium]
MTLTVEIPDQFTLPLSLNGPQPERRALEMLALEGYREGILSRGQLSEMLALSFFETESFLHRHSATQSPEFAEMEKSSNAVRSLLGR